MGFFNDLGNSKILWFIKYFREIGKKRIKLRYFESMLWVIIILLIELEKIGKL